jgi:carboxyl-terminal processing protease
MPATALIFALALLQPQQTDDFAKAWTQTESSIRARYYDRVERKTEMDALLAKYGPLASKAKDRNEFRDTVVRMIDEFGDSHFDFLTPSDQGFYSLGELVPGGKARPMPHVGAWFSRTREGYSVQMVLEGTAAQEAGLLVGDIVETVDSKAFSPIDALKPLVGKEAKFAVRRGSEKRDVTMAVKETEGMALFLEATRNSGRIIERGGRKYGYFHLWTMAKEDFKTALSSFVYGKAMQTDGFILDIRDGFGGRPEGYADPFFRPGAKLEWEIGGTRIPQYFGYDKPLVLIINRGSRSAKEVLAFILKKSKRAVLVGEPTGGNVLGTSPLMLGDWAVVEIPMVDLYVDDVRLEGVGVEPEFLVVDKPTNGRDPFIEKALEVLEMKR